MSFTALSVFSTTYAQAVTSPRMLPRKFITLPSAGTQGGSLVQAAAPIRARPVLLAHALLAPLGCVLTASTE